MRGLRVGLGRGGGCLNWVWAKEVGVRQAEKVGRTYQEEIRAWAKVQREEAACSCYRSEAVGGMGSGGGGVRWERSTRTTLLECKWRDLSVVRYYEGISQGTSQGSLTSVFTERMCWVPGTVLRTLNNDGPCNNTMR